MKKIDNLKLCLKSDNKEKTIINLGDLRIGEDFIMIAGPCCIENEEQTYQTALLLKDMGIDILRGGAFKARTSPYDFQGLGVNGLKILEKVKKELGLPVVTEVLDTRDVEITSRYVDILQIGSRNMQNFSLLKEVGRSKKPVMLKRGMSATLEEWLNCAEYILAEGNPNVILCERGIRTFETYTRNTVDISVVPSVKSLSHLPVLVDPSHGTGKIELIEPMSLAAVVAGADGIMIEVHYNPPEALCDKSQALHPETYSKIIKKVRKLSAFMTKITGINE
ncbi:MAG: 3-deoxy-7-phosphoheptulonate synthase [Acidobacteriota bacterium]